MTGQTTVVHLMGPLRPSGMERMLVSAGPHFTELGVTGIVVGQRDDHPFRAELEQAGYSVRVIPAIKSLAGVRAWMALLRDVDPDVVHIHTEEAFSAAIIAAKVAITRARIVRTFHGFFEASGHWAFKRRVQALLSDRFVDQFVALNKAMAELERSYGRRCVVIPNWVDERFLVGAGNTPTGPDIVIVGNCDPNKNHELVLQCAADNGWTVAHLGLEDHASPRERNLLTGLERTGLLADRGPGDPLPMMRTGRVFALPSQREGFTVALAEAIAMGMTCAVAPIAGTRWAADYPLVDTVPGESAAQWSRSLAEALGRSDDRVLAQSQRDRARPLLDPARGAVEYTAVYRDAERHSTAPRLESG